MLDPLTELLNRRGLERALDGTASLGAREEGSLAMLIDLDRFKDINDTQGHAVGDAVLKEISRHLKGSLRASDTIARVGGDEFIVLLPRTRVAEGLRVAEKIRMAISGASVTTPGGESVGVTASIGMVPLQQDVPSVDSLLTITHGVLNRSKSTGRNRVSYGPENADGRRGAAQEAGASEREKARQALLAGGKFRAGTQPIFELSGRREIAHELFARSVIEGYEMPEDFFEVAAENDMLTFVDLECLKTCLNAASRLSPHLRRHVNLYPSTLAGIAPARILEEFERRGKDGLFCVELSEQQIIGDPSYLAEPAAALRRAGVLIALDDVGYGKSSLESLVMLEPDIVKIDRRCVSGISKSEPAMRRLKRIVAAGTALGAEVIAEGIEDAGDLEAAQSLGIRFGQGFYLGALDSVELAAKGI